MAVSFKWRNEEEERREGNGVSGRRKRTRWKMIQLRDRSEPGTRIFILGKLNPSKA
jgi:hypothetical protein